MKKIMFTLAVFFAALLPAAAEKAAEKNYFDGDFLPNVVKYKMDNGMQVAVIPKPSAAFVTHMVWYRVGSADEAPGQSGIAHFLEHLLFKGSEKFPGSYIDNAVRRTGGQHNAFTSYDYTGYFQKVTKEHLKHMMEIEADRMLNIAFTKEDVKVERNVVLEERARGIESSKWSQLRTVADSALFLNHGYGRPIIGWRHEIKALTHEDLMAFYERFYTPSNALLVVSGNVTVEEVRALANETYGKLKNRAEAVVHKRTDPPSDLSLRQVFSIEDPETTLSHFSMAFRLPSSYEVSSVEATAQYFLGDILGGNTRSRMYQDMVIDRKIAQSVSVSANSYGKDEQKFTFYARPKDPAKLDSMEGEFYKALAKVAKDGITQDELDRARKRLLASTIYSQDSAGSLAQWIGSSFTNGTTLEEMRNWLRDINAVTVEDVQKVAKGAYFDRNKSVIAIMTPPKAAKDPS